MKHIILFIIPLMLFSLTSDAQKEKKPKKKKGKSEQVVLTTHEDSLAYALGISMYNSTANTGMKDFDFDRFMQGMKAQKEGTAKISTTAADSLIRAEMKRINDRKLEENKKAGEEFLANNKTQPGVQTTASGLQYKVVTMGTGAKPDANDKVTVHYHGTLIDGSVFDSSVNRGKPSTFGLNQVIPGWTEGLQLMPQGSKFIFYIPQNLAYGARGQGKISAYSTLIFEVELISVEVVN